MPPTTVVNSSRSAVLDHHHTAYQTAFLNINIGGVGDRARQFMVDRYRADGQPFAMATIHLDTDPATTLDADEHILLQLTGAQVDAMRANPDTFGPVSTAIIQHLKRMLRPGDTLNGSRTTRALTQLSFLYHEGKICRGLQDALTKLRQNFKVSQVTPVFVSSSGGGTGSAAQILLMDLFQRPDFRHRLLGGIPSELLLPPISFVCEPFVYARAASQMQGRKINANAYAFRLESEWMLQRHAANYVAHVGFANNGGTVLSDPDLMSRVLGYAVYEVERCWPALKGRWVDGPDDLASMTAYGGQDSPVFEMPDNVNIHVRRRSP